MKKGIIKILALLMVAAMVFSLGACGKDKGDQTTADASSSLAEGQNDITEGESTDQADESTTLDGEETDTTDETQAETETNAQGEPVSGEVAIATPKDSKPSTPAEILKAYTDVMNKAKTDKPAYKKKEFQALPKSEQHVEGFLLKSILPLAGLFMTEEGKAKVEDNEKGTDMRWFPVYRAKKGCLLTDVNAIKTADFKELSDGNYKVTIVLKDEHNPEPYIEAAGKADSNTGKMFYPLSRKDIDDTLINDNRVNKVVKDVKYDLKYYNCTAELTYNPKTNQVVKLDQYMSVFIDIQDGTVLLSKLKGTAVLVNTTRIWDVKY